MKYFLILLFVTTNVVAQAVYDAQGQNTGSSQIDNGQTNYYSPAGAYQGTNTAVPSPPQVNTTINVPRQAPQAPVMKGW